MRTPPTPRSASLVRSLGLENHVKFLGFQKVEDLMPKIGLIVLSSISEALPLVILEGYAAGVPTVSTDVGSCRQLIEGLGEEDRAWAAAAAWWALPTRRRWQTQPSPC